MTATRQDRTLDHRVGTEVEERRYGYHPDDGAKDSWVRLCTVEGAVGPFTETRTVTYTAWEQDPRDPVRDNPRRRRTGRPAAFPLNGYRAVVDTGEVVTASPTYLCVWARQDGRGHVDDLLAGPFPCPAEVRAPEHLQGWYDGWVAAGRPK